MRGRPVVDDVELRGAYDRAAASWAVAARGWDVATLATPVPATPGWSVHDVLAHVTGATTDLVADEMDGAPGPAWSARHLERWVPRPVDDVVDALLAAAGAVPASVVASPAPTPVWDLVVHRSDVREALGETPVAAEWEPVLGRAWAFVASHPVCPTVRTRDRVWEAAGPSVRLDADDHALFRVLFSRRSRRQVSALVDGDTAAVEALQLFGVRDDDQPSDA